MFVSKAHSCGQKTLLGQAFKTPLTLARKHFSQQTTAKPSRPVNYNQLTHNPIVFNVKSEKFVVAGKEKIVGAWLAAVSASVFCIVWIGGYTRLTKSGLSMVRWEPHRVLPPVTQEDWEKEFEEYKQSPEWLLVNRDKGMDVNGFKYIFFWEWFHRIIGRSIGVLFTGPLIYFMARGYIKPHLRNVLFGLFGLGASQGAIGWWMVKSGLIDKKKTTELDKTPRVSPYRLAVHAGNAYFLYGVLLWQSMNLLRRPQEALINMKNIHAHNQMRAGLRKIVHGFLPLILLTGFFVAGISGGQSCNTYPMVGPHYFLTKNHFVDGIPLWQNFTENKLVAQVNHRTLATLMTLLVSYKTITFLGMPGLSWQARLGSGLLLGSIWMQLGVGVNTIWRGAPVEWASYHQVGAMTVLTAFLFTMHTCRKVDPRHLKNLIGKMKIEDPEAFRRMTSKYNKDMMSKRQYEEIRRQYVTPAPTPTPTQ